MRLHFAPLALIALLLMPTRPAVADVKLPAIFGDGMVLQRRSPLPVWGTAAPGEAVTVTLQGQSKSTTAGDDGKWTLTLDPIEAGGPFELVVKGKNTVTFGDVLAGEVWLCGGQSNMEWRLDQAQNAAAEVAAADYPRMRFFEVPRTAEREPAGDVKAIWKVVTPSNVGGFSAVAYFFGRDVQKAVGVPVGLVGSYWGGTAVEPWMPPAALESAGFADKLAKARAVLAKNDFRRPPSEAKDTGIAKPGWAKVDVDETAWGTAPVPGPFLSDQIDFDGVAWFRRVVDVPAERAGKAMTLRLGAIDDGDVTFFNGTEVGRLGPDNEAWNKPRAYAVPGELVKAGRNVIAVRVFDQRLGGGFAGPAEAMTLAPAGGGGGEAIPLAGAWRVAIEKLFVPDPDEIAWRASFPVEAETPTMLYNGMIAPLTPFAVRGFLWYQGESNAGEPQDYAALLRGMIGAWRREFAGPAGDAPQPFLIVQLANWQPRSTDPNVAPGWALLRDAQRQVADEAGNGLAVAVDIGDAVTIHPLDKQDVGRRLALLALRDAYGKGDVVARGPTLASATAGDGTITLAFDHADGLTLDGPAGQTFAVGGDDGKFVWATPKVEGDKVVLGYTGVASPKVVRYAWQNNPPAPLFNAAGLPAVPFEIKVGGD